MSAGPDAVRAALEDAIFGPNREIDLAAAAADPALAGLRPVLEVLRHEDGFVLSGARPPEVVDGTVALSANGFFGLPGAPAQHLVPVLATLTYSAAAGRDRFVLALKVLSADWTFSTTFPVLPLTQTARPTGETVRADSFLIGLPLSSPVFTATAETGADPQLELAGKLPMEGVLQPYADRFGAGPLDLSGSVVLPASLAEPPGLHLFAPAAAQPDLELGPVALRRFGLGIRTVTGLDPRSFGFSALSALDASAELHLGSDAGPPAARATFPLLAGGPGHWRLIADFGPHFPTLAAGLAAVARLLGLPGDVLAAVPGLPQITGFALTEAEAGLLAPGQPGGPALEYAAVTLVSELDWLPTIPFFALRRVGMRWVAYWDEQDGATPGSFAGSFFGDVEVTRAEVERRREAGRRRRRRAAGIPEPQDASAHDASAAPTAAQDELAFTFRLSASYPGWAVSGRMTEGDIPLGELLGYFLGAPSPLDSLKVTELGFEADLEEQRFAAAADIDADLPVPLAGGVTLVLTGLGLNVAAEAGSVTGGLLAGFGLAGAAPPGEPEPRFFAGAEYTGAPAQGGEGWVFTGGLADGSTVDLVNLVAALARGAVPDWAGRLSLVVLDARFATGTEAFHFAGALAGRWQPELFGQRRSVSAEARAEVSRAAADRPLTARLAGTFTVDRLTVGAAAVLDADEATYELSVDFGGLTLAAVTGWRGEPGQPDRHQVISFQVGGATLGELIEQLAALAAPTADVRLEPPWDVLGRIELSRFTVTVDPTEQTVELVYRADAALPLIAVETVGLKLVRSNGRSSLELILTGGFLGRDYTQQRPLSWDLLSQNPPTVPGAGSQLLDLRYLALGQRIRLVDPPGTVRAVVDRLRRDMEPARPDANPLRGSPMRFSADAEWLIGLDATVAGLLDLAVVFNDPRLYGLAVGLRGQKAGGLAGLAFEVLYKKVSDDVGVFRVELRLPEAFRRIELGAVSVTAGLVVVEVYTDGGFLVDLGFPHEGDFSRAFSVEAFPFLGRGGLYFGVLRTAGGDLVPAVSNGVFSPVIALGVGFAGGVGKEVRSGPLSGGAYVELSALFEGVFAWFTPTGAGAASAVYHWVQASVGVHGKVYGSVELAVLKASITIEAWASATVVLEAFRATRVAVSARVEVNASLQIAFIQLSFTFQAEVDLGFTLGTDQPAPWILTAAGRPGRRALPAPRHRPEVQTRLLRAAHLRSLAARSADPELKWNPDLPVFTDSPRWTEVYLLPLYSATDLPVAWDAAADGEAARDPAAFEYRIAFTLFAEDGGTITPAGQPRPPASAELSTQTADPRKLAAQTFVEALLRWSISAVADSPGNDPNATVTAGQLRFLAEQLDAPQTVEGPFGLTDLGRFFAANAPWRILAEPAVTGPAEAAVREGVAIPLPPYLTWNSPQWGERHFISHNGVGPVYLAGAAAYAAQFAPTAPAEAAPPPPDDPTEYQSFATRAFRDWCLMVAKTGVQAAVDAMTVWSEKLEADSSLAEAALRFPRVTVAYAVRAGDTLDSVAGALGATADQLAFLDETLAARLAAAAAGAVIDVVLGVTPEMVAADNAAWPLRSVVLELGTMDYPVAAGDSLAQVAGRFGLPGPAALFTDPARDLAGDGRLLRNGASAPVHAQRVTWSGSRIMAAAVFFTHFYAERCAVEDVDGAAWYMQFLFDRNSDRIRGGAGEPIAPGTVLDVPLAKYSSATEKYTSVPGDTVGLLGAALALARDFAAQPAGPDGWPAFRDAVAAVPGGQIDLPEARLTVLSGESLRRFAERSALYPDIAAAAVWLGQADVLTPTFLLPVPHARTDIAPGENLSAVAARLGLSLADLAHRIRNAVIYQASREKPLTLTVAHLLVQSIDKLVGAVIDKAALDVAGNSARQLLSGQRLPERIVAPDGRVTAGPETEPLYTLTGQMGQGPAPNVGPPDQVALQVDFGVEPGVPWIELSGSAVAQPDPAGRTPGQAVLPPEYEPFNPAVAHDPDRLRPGMILRTGAVDALGFRITYGTLLQRYPGAMLNVKPLAGPAALPTAIAVPLAYDLPRRIALQAPKPAELAIPQDGAAPLTGQATVWPFPPKLLARARNADSSLRYDVAAFVRRDQRDPADLLFDTTFGTMFSFGVRRIEDRPGVYELLPADQSDRATALALSRYVAAGGPATGTAAYLLASPAPDATDNAGQIVLDAAPTGTYVLRTNLSTQNEPPPAGSGAAAAGPGYGYADLADLAGFCLLLWAGSVTGGTGCLVGFATEDGEELPPGLFDEQGTARLSLLAIPGEQQQPARFGRPLLPVNTCALAAPTLDPGLSALFVEAADDSEYTLEPALPPGTAGFRLHLADPGDGQTPDAVIQRLFSLMTAAIPSGGPDGRYVMPPTGLPAGPQVDDGSGLELWQRERRARRLRAGRELPAVAAAARWGYTVALPVTRFGPASPLPALPGLPRPELDPYRGLAGDALPLAGLRLGFADVLGNVTAASGGNGGLLPVPIGYTDPLLPVGAWPAATVSYAVAGVAPEEIRLVVTLAAQPGAAGGPGAGAGPDEARAAALQLAERYAQVYYQPAAGRVTATLLSTLRQLPDGSEEPLPVDAAPLWRFAAAAHAAARAAAALRPVTAGGKPAELAAARGISLADLARVNALRPVAAIFGALRPAVPGYTVVGAGDTADSLRTGLRSGWPDPGSGTALLGLPANLALPLRPGTALATPPRSHRTPAPGPHTLAELARTLHTTPGLLAQDNATTAGILQPGFYFVLDGVPVQVPEDPAFTFEQARIAFDGLGIGATVATLATEAAERPGMIRGDAQCVSKHYLAAPGETLERNGSTFTGAQLAALNAATADLFDDGALVFLGAFDPAVTKPEDDDTLAGYAGRFGCPPDLLLAANAQAQLPADALVLPGTAAVPPPGDPERPVVPYTAAPGESLAGIGTLFAATALAVAEASRGLPGLLTAGRQITVRLGSDEARTVTVAGDSLDAVLARLRQQVARIELADLVAAIGPVSGLLAADALLLCPTAVLPGTPGTGVSPRDAGQRYHLDPAALAEANLATTGLVAAEVLLNDPAGGQPVLTGQRDTLNSLTARFARGEAVVTVAQIIAANADKPMFAAGAGLLLPPAPVRLSASLGTALGEFAAPVFPLRATLRLTRPAALIDPSFRTPDGTGTTQRADTVVPAPATSQGGAGEATLTLAAFAAAFHAAYPQLRLGTARASAAATATGAGAGAGIGNGAGAAPIAADLWVTDFRPGPGISEVSLHGVVPFPGLAYPAPRCFALRPLYQYPVNRPRLPVQALLPDGTLAPIAVPVDFLGVDVEVLARRLLADVDRFLSAGCAPGVYADPDARGTLKTVLEAKARLAGAVADGLEAVLDLPDPDMRRGQVSAAAALSRELATGLSRAYDAAAVVQYGLAVDSPWTGNPALPPARLAGPARPVLAPDQSEAVPYTLSSARLPLAEPESFVNFLMRVPDPARHRKIDLDVEYSVLDMQFGVSAVPGLPGFEDAAWLSFYPPLAGTDRPAPLALRPGRADVPIPLRAYPDAPALLGHSALPTVSGRIPELAEARLWNYTLIYAHEHAEQDEVLVTVRFNFPARTARGASPDGDVAAALLRYAYVADPLWGLLAKYTGGEQADAAAAAHAAATFAELVKEAAQQWELHWTARDADAEPDSPPAAAAPSAAPPRTTYNFRVRVHYEPDDDGVMLLREVVLYGPGTAPVDPATWPTVACRRPDGSDEPLHAQPPAPASRVYRVSESVRIPAGPPPTITLGWAGLPISAYQNAAAELFVRRNQHLLGESGPATRDAFVFRTTATESQGSVNPMLSWPAALDISSLATTFGGALAEAFRVLSDGSSGLAASVGVDYGRPQGSVLDPAGRLAVLVPVALGPNIALTEAGGRAVAAQAEDWYRRTVAAPVPTPGRFWAVTVTVPSELDPASRQPLLTLARLIYREAN